jgi:iron complex transport system permease protein
MSASRDYAMTTETEPKPGDISPHGLDDDESPDDTSGGWGWWLVFTLGLAALMVGSLTVGRYALGPGELFKSLVAVFIPGVKAHLTLIDKVVLDQIRLPRVLAAVMVGAAMSGSGAALQSMFQNPLVSPDILGVSAGAGVGASLGLFFSLSFGEVQLLAFAGGIVAVTVTATMARMMGRGSTVVLVLSGIVVGAMAQAIISLTQYFANPTTTLPRIVFFLLGSLDSVTMSTLWLPAILVVISIVALYLIRWPITVLAAGEDEARSLGIHRQVVWAIVIVATTLMTSAVVSVAGIVGWVGLVVPHLARYIVGPTFQKLLPASLLLGAFFLLAVDDLGRSVSSVELPLGVLTALIGAPFFVAIVTKTRRQWH